MASIIRIKRSSVSGNPTVLGAGELAYSALTNNDSNGGDRLYIGIGAETAGDAANHLVIGGKYFTDLLDHTRGTLTASSALVVDSNKKLDELLVDDLSLNGNTLSATGTLKLQAGTGNIIELAASNYISGGSFGGSQLILDTGTAAVKQLRGGDVSLTVGSDGNATASLTLNNDASLSIPGTIKTLSNGDLTLAPNGSGKLVLNNPYINGTTDTLAEYIYDLVGGAVTGGTGITISNSDAGNSSTVSITNTGVTADSYGSATAIPVLTVNAQGQITVASTAEVASTLNIAGDTGTDGIALLSETLTFVGGTGITSTVTANTVTFDIDSTVATLTGTQTLTNKTINLANNTLTATSAQLAAAVTDETGSGSLVFATSPTLVTPTLGAATATSINKVTITAPTNGSTLTISDGKTFTVNNTLTLTGTDTSSVAFGAGGTVAYVANKLNVFAATTSAELADVISDETGTGALVFANTPTLVTPNIGDATAASITGTSGNLAITAFAGNNNVNLIPTGTGTVDVASKRITSLADPTQDQDAATKAYVDAVKTGLDVKESVRAATTENITLSGTQTIDGISVIAGERVLVKNQNTGSQNGIYVVSNSAWTRAIDFDNTPGTEVTGGAFTFVEEGTTNADSGWVLTTNGVITIGTTALSFAQFSGAGQIAAGAGLTKTGNTIDVVGTADRITVNADSIDIASTYVGQTSITTLGTIGTGTWEGTVVGPTYGGTGVNNGSKTITLGGNLTTSGSFATTLTVTGTTSVTLPTTGTLATLAGTETLTNKTITGATISTGSINNTPIGASTRNTGAFTTLAANGAVTFTADTGSSSSTTGTLVVTGGVGISQNLYGAGAATSTLDGFNIDGGTY